MIIIIIIIITIPIDRLMLSVVPLIEMNAVLISTTKACALSELNWYTEAVGPMPRGNDASWESKDY